jgi:hypothetical protein
VLLTATLGRRLSRSSAAGSRPVSRAAIFLVAILNLGSEIEHREQWNFAPWNGAFLLLEVVPIVGVKYPLFLENELRLQMIFAG